MHRNVKNLRIKMTVKIFIERNIRFDMATEIVQMQPLLAKIMLDLDLIVMRSHLI